MVVIDTDILITSYRRGGSPERNEVVRLVQGREAATAGIILAEVLRGARSDAEFEAVKEELLAMEFLDADQAAWLLAARILFDLKAGGEIIPLPDALIAAQAMLADCAVYTHDVHFQRIPGLRLHAATGATS